MTPAPENRSVGELLRDLANDVTNLIRQELVLARTEAQEKMNQTMTAVFAIIAGALLAFAALIILLQALVVGLSNFMYDWVAAILVGGVVAIIGFIMVRKGQNDLSASRLAPDRTAANLRKDVNLVKEQVS